MPFAGRRSHLLCLDPRIIQRLVQNLIVQGVGGMIEELQHKIEPGKPIEFQRLVSRLRASMEHLLGETQSLPIIQLHINRVTSACEVLKADLGRQLDNAKCDPGWMMFAGSPSEACGWQNYNIIHLECLSVTTVLVYSACTGYQLKLGMLLVVTSATQGCNAPVPCHMMQVKQQS